MVRKHTWGPNDASRHLGALHSFVDDGVGIKGGTGGMLLAVSFPLVVSFLLAVSFLLVLFLLVLFLLVLSLLVVM